MSLGYKHISSHKITQHDTLQSKVIRWLGHNFELIMLIEFNLMRFYVKVPPCFFTVTHDTFAKQNISVDDSKQQKVSGVHVPNVFALLIILMTKISKSIFIVCFTQKRRVG